MAAIYMWRGVNHLVLTTTLYPVDTSEQLELSFTFTSGTMPPVPGDESETHTEDLISGYYTQVRWFYEDGPYIQDKAETYDEDLLNAYYTQVRWFYEDGPYADVAETEDDLLNGYYRLKGVLADAPTEELQLSFTITSGSMELI